MIRELKLYGKTNITALEGTKNREVAGDNGATVKEEKSVTTIVGNDTEFMSM